MLLRFRMLRPALLARRCPAPVPVPSPGAVATTRPTNAAATIRQRPLSSSAGNGGGNGVGKKSAAIPFEPPPIRADPGAILRERAARARRLHEEIHELLDDQAKRRAEEAARPFGSDFLDFVRKSRSELINIGAAFACVILAYQIAAMKRGARAMESRMEEREETIRELRGTLASISGEEFAVGAARACVVAVRDGDSMGGSFGKDRASYGVGGLFGWGRGVPADNELPHGEGANHGDLVEALRVAIQREICAVVGDRALSEREKEEKHLRDLQHSMAPNQAVDSMQSSVTNEGSEGASSGKVQGGREGTLGGLEEVLVEVQKGEAVEVANGSSGAVKKRIKYAI